MYDGFIVSGCVLAILIGLFFGRIGYVHLLWIYEQHIFMKYFEKQEERNDDQEKTIINDFGDMHGDVADTGHRFCRRRYAAGSD